MKIKITDTILRDAHQSLAATRMSTKDMEPALELMDQVGYHALEMWGGATFDASLRFLKEDPWERLRLIRSKVKHTKLQMLLRGQNILGYKHYPDDVLELFIQKAVSNGIDIIRIFDALNDVRNLETAMRVTKREGAHAQGAISYTTSPVHTTELYVKLAKDLRDMGADSIAIKDMSGLLLPLEAEKLVKAIHTEVDLPIELHSHMTSGLADMMYLKGIEAGASIIDTALTPFAMGTSQPATESMVMALKDSPYDTGLNMDALIELTRYFKPIKNRMLKEGIINPLVMGIDIESLWSQVPGGMLSNLVSQLTMQGDLDKLPQVMEEIPRVRKDLGYPPLVTPTSQMVGAQALINVVAPNRYAMIPKEVKDYVRGLYGRSPAEIDPEIMKKVLGDNKPIDHRPADDLQPMIPALRAQYPHLSDEDLLSMALFPQVAQAYFESRSK